MKKVLFVIHALGFGGAERSLVNLLNELPEDRYQVDLLLFRREGAFLNQLPQWVRVLETPDRLRKLYGPLKQAGNLLLRKAFGTLCSKIVRKKGKARAAFRWKKFYQKAVGRIPGHYDVAVAYTGSEVMFLVRDCVDAERKLVWIHNDYNSAKYSESDDRPYMADMDAIVSVSEECVNTLREVFPEYEEKLHCVENITSSTLVRRQGERFIPEEYSTDDCNLLSIGRLWSQKGFDLAVSAAAIMKKAGFAFRWYIIGEGKLREKLLQQIQEEAVEDRVILLGTRENPYPYIKHCSLLVQPSRFEGKSVVLDEAKILAVPIAATNYPTVADQILAEREGVILEMSPESIAEGLMELLSDADRLSGIRAYLREREYGNQREVQKYMQLLDG